MASYFFDSSALIKRYLAEPGHAWTFALCRPQSGNTITIAEATLTEVTASFCRMVRENPPRLKVTARDRLISLFNQHVRRNYVVVQVNRAVFTRAAALCRTHPLRAYDAIQLACALTKRDDDARAGLAAPIFVC